MNATPRPWKKRDRRITGTYITSRPGDPVSYALVAIAEMPDDAALIVAAVNSYDAMREAIAEMLLDLASSEYKTVKSFLEWSASIERARAALALAEGGAK